METNLIDQGVCEDIIKLTSRKFCHNLFNKLNMVLFVCLNGNQHIMIGIQTKSGHGAIGIREGI